VTAPDAAEPIVLFVYGSLLAGQPAHGLLAGARFAGRAQTPPCYTLLDGGDFPALVLGGTSAVEGELYEVGDAETWARLDDYEGHPGSFQRTVIALAGGTRVQCYLLDASQAAGWAPIPSGSWQRARGER
jgi:gamma-glutamylaminecyclotransferase